MQIYDGMPKYMFFKTYFFVVNHEKSMLKTLLGASYALRDVQNNSTRGGRN